jgi:hypothetical protein
MVESLWQDAVVRGLLASGVSLGVQWAAPKVLRAYRRLRARRSSQPARVSSGPPGDRRKAEARESGEQ